MGTLRYEFNRVYVVDRNGGLAGQISVVDLALSLEQARIRDIAGPAAATVTADTPAAECARLRRHYNIVQLPVVAEGTLLGVIPSEFLLSAVVEEDTRQMLNVGAVSGDSGETSLVSAIRTRLPWLTINLATTFLAAATISLFESTLAKVVILAAFLPVVAGQGGIGGTQTLTMIVPFHGPRRIRGGQRLAAAGPRSVAGRAPRRLAGHTRRGHRVTVDAQSGDWGWFWVWPWWATWSSPGSPAPGFPCSCVELELTRPSRRQWW